MDQPQQCLLESTWLPFGLWGSVSWPAQLMKMMVQHALNLCILVALASAPFSASWSKSPSMSHSLDSSGP